MVEHYHDRSFLGQVGSHRVDGSRDLVMAYQETLSIFDKGSFTSSPGRVVVVDDHFVFEVVCISSERDNPFFWVSITFTPWPFRLTRR